MSPSLAFFAGAAAMFLAILLPGVAWVKIMDERDRRRAAVPPRPPATPPPAPRRHAWAPVIPAVRRTRRRLFRIRPPWFAVYRFRAAYHRLYGGTL